jgi:hypothetical protein
MLAGQQLPLQQWTYLHASGIGDYGPNIAKPKASAIHIWPTASPLTKAQSWPALLPATVQENSEKATK